MPPQGGIFLMNVANEDFLINAAAGRYLLDECGHWKIFFD